MTNHNEPIEFIAGNDPKFFEYYKNLVNSYNESPLCEYDGNTIKNVSSVFLLMIGDHSGLVIDEIDRMNHRGICHLIYIAPELRGKGLGRLLVTSSDLILKAKGGFLVGAFVDVNDPLPFWCAVGYRHKDMLNLTEVMLCKNDINDCFPTASKTNHAEALMQLLRGF